MTAITPESSDDIISVDLSSQPDTETPVAGDSAVGDFPTLEDEIAALRLELAAANAKLDSERDTTLRAVADFRNYRRRSEEERDKLVTHSNVRLIKEWLPLIDDFERAVAAADKMQSPEQVVGAVEALLRKFQLTLENEGVNPIPAIGQMFDPNLHEAITIDSMSDQPDETVVMEHRKGYSIKGYVIRPALVTVAKSAE